jgi:hypothetical protein
MPSVVLESGSVSRARVRAAIDSVFAESIQGDALGTDGPPMVGVIADASEGTAPIMPGCTNSMPCLLSRNRKETEGLIQPLGAALLASGLYQARRFPLYNSPRTADPKDHRKLAIIQKLNDLPR